MLKISLISDAGERWSSGIICRNLMRFLDPKIVCDFAGFRVIWFTPLDTKYDIMFLQCANRMQGRQIWKLRKVRDHLKADTRLTCGVRGTNSLRETGRFLEYYDAVECANKQLLEQVKEKNPNAYLGRSGVDTQMFRPLDIKEPDEFTIGFAGSKYRRVKNFEAIERLGYPITIAAKQESFERQEWTIGDIHASGFRRDPYDTPTYWNYKKMPIFHGSYDLYVCASKHEGGPNPVLEACACGKPVVSTNVAWIPDLLEPEWIVDGDPGIDREAFNSLKAKVDLLASDPDLRQEVGKRNRREVIKKWDWRVIIKEWETFFKAAWETRLE